MSYTKIHYSLFWYESVLCYMLRDASSLSWYTSALSLCLVALIMRMYIRLILFGCVNAGYTVCCGLYLHSMA